MVQLGNLRFEIDSLTRLPFWQAAKSCRDVWDHFAASPAAALLRGGHYFTDGHVALTSDSRESAFAIRGLISLKETNWWQLVIN